MPNFQTYVDRYGENMVQHLIEMIERNDGVKMRGSLPLNERWDRLMQDGDIIIQKLAA